MILFFMNFTHNICIRDKMAYETDSFSGSLRWNDPEDLVPFKEPLLPSLADSQLLQSHANYQPLSQVCGEIF